MNNDKYLLLNSDQINFIKSIFPQWDDEFVEYSVIFTLEDNSFGHEFGTEKVIDKIIKTLDFIVDKRVITVINYFSNFEHHKLKLTNEQYNEVLKNND